ncbi:hypothetical protein GQ600_84 [Phytophthora cactorum]|nr:hypothetical protein GQ600_84 [Phytophthora cactorum]
MTIRVLALSFFIFCGDLASTDSSAFVVDDEEFHNKVIAILNSFDDEHLENSASIDFVLDAANQVRANARGPLGQGQLLNIQNQAVCIINVPIESDATAKLTPTTRDQGRGRIPVREQLIPHREVVRKMENQLETLNNPRSGSCKDNQAMVATNEKQMKRQSIANKQFRVRRKAEVHIAQQRENLWACIQLSKRVKNSKKQSVCVSISVHHVQYMQYNPYLWNTFVANEVGAKCTDIMVRKPENEAGWQVTCFFATREVNLYLVENPVTSFCKSIHTCVANKQALLFMYSLLQAVPRRSLQEVEEAVMAASACPNN